MSGNSEMMDAFKMLSAGVSQYQTTQAVNDARDQMAKLNSQELDKQAQLDANAKVGQELALRLTSAGAAPDRIQAATAGLMPSASLESQNQATLGLETMKTKSSEKIEDMKVQSAADIEKMKVDAIMGKADKATLASTAKEVKLFGDQPQVKSILQGLPKLDAALQSIKDNKGEFGITAVINLAQLGLIRNAAGRVNEKEIMGANESQSARAKLWKEMNLQGTGEVPTNVQDFWQKIMEQSKQFSLKQLHESAEGHAASLHTMNPSVDQALFSKAVHQRYGIPVPPANPNQAAIEQAKAWLADPNNATSPKRDQVVQQITKMGGQP